MYRHELRTVLALALPAIGTSLVQTLVFLFDRVFLGHHSEEALAALQTAGPTAWTVWAIFGSFTVGTTAVVGRAFGAKDTDEATAATQASLLLALVMGVVVGAIGLLLLPYGLDRFGMAGGPRVRANAEEFLGVFFPALPLYFLGYTAITVLQSSGDTRTPLLIGIVTNGANIFANWVLVFGNLGAPALGCRGSAIGSALAVLLETSLGVGVLLSSRSPVRLVNSISLRARWESAMRVMRVSIGAIGERTINQLGYMLFIGYVLELGAASMAANQALISIESISFLTGEGCSAAAGALVALALGEGSTAKAKRAGWLSAALCGSLLAIFGLVFLVFPEALVGIFRNDPAIIVAGAAALRVAALAQVPMAIGMVLAQATRAAGATRQAMAISLLGVLVVRIAATHIAVRWFHLGLMGIWLGSACDWFVRSTLYVIIWKREYWSKANV